MEEERKKKIKFVSIAFYGCGASLSLSLPRSFFLSFAQLHAYARVETEKSLQKQYTRQHTTLKIHLECTEDDSER